MFKLMGKKLIQKKKKKKITQIKQPGLQIRVRIEIFSSIFLIQNIWCGYSKEPSQLDGPLEHPNHMFKLMGKKIIKSLRNIISLSGSMNSNTSVQNMKKP